jgi:hypothetical protein
MTTTSPPIHRLVLSELSRTTRILIVLGAVAAALGVVDSLTDPDGDRIWGALPVAVPSIVTVWACLELLWRRSDLALHVRLFIACLVPGIPSAGLSALIASVITMLPPARAVIDARTAANGGFHYWFDDAVGLAVLPLHLFAGWGIAGFLGLVTVLVVVLPIAALRGDRELPAGLGVDARAPAPVSRGIVVPLSFALSALMAGLLLCVGAGERALARTPWGAMANAPRVLVDRWYLADALWALGVLLLIGAAVLAVVAVGRNRRARSEPEPEPLRDPGPGADAGLHRPGLRGDQQGDQ